MSDLFGETDGGSKYLVNIDKRWQLDDLTVFSKAYEESYFAIFGLLAVVDTDGLDLGHRSRVARTFEKYPWRGGYSAVNFFRELKKSVPKKGRPTIRQIKYASPGIIELFLDQNVAVQIGTVVGGMCGTVRVVNSTYHAIYRGYIDRQLAKISVEKAQIDLARDDLDFIAESNEKLGPILGIEDVETVNRATGHPLRTLKIQLAIFDELRSLRNFKKTERSSFQISEFDILDTKKPTFSGGLNQIFRVSS